MRRCRARQVRETSTGERLAGLPHRSVDAFRARSSSLPTASPLLRCRRGRRPRHGRCRWQRHVTAWEPSFRRHAASSRCFVTRHADAPDHARPSAHRVTPAPHATRADEALLSRAVSRCCHYQAPPSFSDCSRTLGTVGARQHPRQHAQSPPHTPTPSCCFVTPRVTCRLSLSQHFIAPEALQSCVGPRVPTLVPAPST